MRLKEIVFGCALGIGAIAMSGCATKQERAFVYDPAQWALMERFGPEMRDFGQTYAGEREERIMIRQKREKTEASDF